MLRLRRGLCALEAGHGQRVDLAVGPEEVAAAAAVVRPSYDPALEERYA